MGFQSFVAPAHSSVSTGLMLAAATLISTSPVPTTGSGWSKNFRTSGPPYRSMTTAFMALASSCTRSRRSVFALPTDRTAFTLGLLRLLRLESDLVHDRFVFDKVVHRGDAVHSPEAALLVAAFLGFAVDDRPIVDPNRASVDLSRDAQRPVHIRGPDRRGKPIDRVVGERDRLGLGIEGLHNEN